MTPDPMPGEVLLSREDLHGGQVRADDPADDLPWIPDILSCKLLSTSEGA